MILELTELNSGDMLDHCEDIADTMWYNQNWWIAMPGDKVHDACDAMDERFERSFS
jgi:hypothetical protein